MSKSQYKRLSTQMPEFVAEIREQAQSELLSTLRDEVANLGIDHRSSGHMVNGYIQCKDDVLNLLNKP